MKSVYLVTVLWQDGNAINMNAVACADAESAIIQLERLQKEIKDANVKVRKVQLIGASE